jgi:hypothetical protein
MVSFRGEEEFHAASTARLSARSAAKVKKVPRQVLQYFWDIEENSNQRSFLTTLRDINKVIEFKRSKENGDCAN